jgi:hypothetical protein
MSIHIVKVKSKRNNMLYYQIIGFEKCNWDCNKICHQKRVYVKALNRITTSNISYCVNDARKHIHKVLDPAEILKEILV